MNEEELKAIVDKMIAEGSSDDEIRAKIAELRGQPASTTDPSKSNLDADGINTNSYIDGGFWEEEGLDRSSYFDEEGNLVDPNTGGMYTGYDAGYEQILKELETKNILTRDSSRAEDTATEGEFEVTDEDKENISKNAESTYETHVQQEIDYLNITYEDKKREEELRAKYGLETAEWNIDGLMELRGVDTSKLPSNIETAYKNNKNNYFNQKLNIAKGILVEESGYAPGSVEANKLLEKLATVKIDDIESGVIEPQGEGERGLTEIFESISNSDPKFKEAVLESERVNERNATIRNKASEMAKALDSDASIDVDLTFNPLGDAALAFDWLFGDSETKEKVSGQSNEDFQKIEDETREKGIEGNLIHEQYRRIQADLTKTTRDLEAQGDAKAKIEEIKAKHDLTTNSGIEAANKEIKSFINGYTKLIDKHNDGLAAMNDISLAAAQIQEEFGDLVLRERDLEAFTNQIGKNHRTATMMALAFGNATVDLAEGAADFVYMINPLGALADELLDYVGEDSYLGTVVEVARLASGPISWYSGDRRDDVKDAINGYQEHVSSLVAEAPRYEDISSTGDAIKWGLITGATQAPQLAILAATGGTAGLVMMGAMSAGQKFSAMEDQKELWQKTGGLYGLDHSFGTMYAASMASGLVETLSEKVTLGLMKGGGGMISNALFKDVGSKTMGSFFRRHIWSGDALKYSAKKLIDISEEGGSEVLATIGANYIDRLAGDKTINILSGVEESFVTGALIGATISMPSVFADIHSSFKSVEAAEVLAANFSRMEEQNAIMNSTKEGSPEYTAAYDLNQMLVAENAEVIAIDVKRVDSLSPEEKGRLIEIETENRKLQQQAVDIFASTGKFGRGGEDNQVEALKETYARNLNEKNAIIAQYPADQVLRDHKQDLERLQDQSDAIEAEGGAKINTTRAKSKTDEGIKIEFDTWLKNAEKKGNVRIAASEDGTREEDAKEDGTGVYGAMVAVLNEAGEVTSYEMFFNEKNIYEDGKTTTASHELLHAAVFNTIRANPVLRRRFGEAIENILDGPGVKINEEARKDLERVKQYGKTARGEEIFAIVSENMVKGNITIDGGAIGKMKDLMRRTSMSTTETDIEFNDEQDVRNFLKDYSKSRTKGINDKRITSLFVKGAKGKLVDTPATREEAKKIVQERHEEQAKEDFYETLMASMKAQPDMRQEIDDIVKNPDGTPKFKTKQDFNRRGGVEAAWTKISQSPLLDGLIQQGMTELGLPPQAMKDFTRSVKEGLMDRLYNQYDPAKNDSLFGWLTGVSGGAGRSQIYRAKGDVMNAYKDSNKLNTVSLDAPMGEMTSFEATIEAETDAFMVELDNMDMTRTREAREARKPKKVVKELNVSNEGKASIKQAVVGAKLSLEGVQYKDVKKLTTGKKAPLASVLDVIADKFGVDPKRIVKPSDLDGKQRAAAQKFINEKAAFLLEMLPDGETVSGEATGVANTKLGELYEKGERLKFKAGATAAGKFSQQKKSDVTVEQFKELFGIKPDGTFDNNRKHDGAIKALVNQATVLAANQALREDAMENGTSSQAVIAKLGEGRAEIMFSARPKNKNTFVQLYPDLIKEVGKTNPGNLEAVTAAVTYVYKDTGENIKKISEEVYETVKEFNTSKKKARAAGYDLDKDLTEYLENDFEDKQLVTGIHKKFAAQFPDSGLFIDENGKTIHVGEGHNDYDRVMRLRAAIVLIGNELMARGHTPKRTAEILLSLHKPMFAGATKIGDGRWTGVDGKLTQTPNWIPGIRNVDKTVATIETLSPQGLVEFAEDILGDNYYDGPRTNIGNLLVELPHSTDTDVDWGNYSTSKLRKALVAQAKKQGKASNRKQGVHSTSDFVAIMNQIPGLGTITKEGGYLLEPAISNPEQVLIEAMKVVDPATNDDGRVKLNTKLKSQKANVLLNEWGNPDEVKRKENWDTRKQQTKDARFAAELLMDIYSREVANTAAGKPGSNYDALDWAMAATSLGTSISGPMRMGALAEYEMEGVRDIVAEAKENSVPIGEVTEVEHAQTQLETMEMMLGSYFKNGAMDQSIWDKYKVAIIGSDMNTAINDAGNKLRSPSGENRYYRIKNLGDTRFRPMKSNDPAKKGTTKEFIGKEWVKASDAIAKDPTAARGDQKVLQAIASNVSFSKRAKNQAKPKGISVLDFDDTLATTKSGVKARVPNPDGTPKPGRKVIFMAGGAGSGKGNVISKLGLEKAGYKTVNSDISLEWLKKNHGLPENQTDYTAEQRSQLSKLTWEARKIAKRKQGKFAGNGDGIVVDGTGGSTKVMQAQVQAFKDKGYDVSMVFVETSLEVAKQRNAARKERSLKGFILTKNHEQVQGNKEAFKELFGENFNEISTDNVGLEDALPKKFKNKIDNFTNSYENRRLDAEEFAREGADIKEMGGEFDFSEFNEVVDGKTAPLFNKAMKLSGKFGTDNMFILTARSPESAEAIKRFLDMQGLNIPLKNITGLGQSEASAKANWIAEKIGEGYNDFYFADDAMQNVEAVQAMLNKHDVKGKVQQAMVEFSMRAPVRLSNIIDESIGVDPPTTPRDELQAAEAGVYTQGYSKVSFSKRHRAEYEARLLSKNPDIETAKEAKKHVDALFNWVNSAEVPAKKKSKLEKLALHYMVNNKLRMPEDGYKVVEAEKLAEAKKIDPFSFKNPNDIIEKYSGEVTKKNPNPDQHLKENDNIGSFFNKREIGNGITVYDVKNGYPGMFATRNMVNEHFGKKSNPWCITQAIDGEITPAAKEYWDQYGTKQILFKDGKLLAMRTESIEGALTDAGDIEFWSRENVRFNEIPGNNYVDKQGREIRSSFNEKTGEDSGIIYGATKGSIESGKLEIYDTYTSEGHYHPQKARYLGDGVKVQLYLDQVERYNKKGQLHGTQEQHTNPVSLEREGYASSITLTKEYKNGDFIGSRTDYGDGQGLGSFQEKLDSRLQKLGDDRAAQREGNIMFSKRGKPTPDSTDLDLNVVLEQTKGVNRNKEFSAAKARKRGKGKGRFKFFVPPSADDFAGLMYAFMGKGKQGEKHHKFFKENLFDPFSKGIRNLNIVKQTVANDLRQLRKAMPDVRKKLDKTVPGTEYTHEDAIRVYNWTQSGFDIPGLSETDKQMLVKVVENDASLNAFAQGVNSISNTPGGMVDPGNHWLGGNIALDLKEALDVARSTHLQQWKDNKDIMFNEANMNKIEAIYGSNFREALEDSLYRMEHGGNRSRGSGRLLNNFTNWIHGSIGTTMFLNARSAMLQMISNVNFVNWSDNNMVAAAGAFANQKQYWGDVSMIFNSPFLKQRRSGIQTDVNASELLAQIKDSKNQVKAATAYLLQLGFTPTQIADSFAIATGGATFYRNRMKTYLKEGMTQAEAETKAFEDMMEIAEETQQSTREDKISQQQASPLGKFILAFQNTPMQYNRLIKKASLDLVNGRGDPKANISRIVYYGGIQNLIFYGLQSALFAALFSDDEEDQITDKKKERVMNGMVDTLLRGSGIGGAIVATVKNVIIKFMKEEEKEKDDNFMTQADHANTLIAALNISPPIGIKARKLYGASQTLDFNRDVIDHMSKTDIDNPIYDAVSSAVQAVTNLPLNRLYNKYQNISEALNSDNEMWQRIAMFLGWNKWDFGIENQDVVAAEGKVKEIKAVEAEERREMKKRAKDVERQAEEEEVIESNLLEQDEEREEGQEDIKCAAVSRSGSRCGKKVKDGGNYCTIHENAPQRANGEKTQCSHVKPNGDRCKMKTANQSGKCYYHD